MRRLPPILLLCMFAATGVAHAAGCPGKIAHIDASLDSGTHAELGEDTLAEVRKLRDEGERLHSGGDHAAAMASLERAMALLEEEQD